jgi:hypothetical protein
MKSVRSSIALSLVYVLLMLNAASGREAFGQCFTPNDASSVITAGSIDNCGNTSWDLKVNFGPEGPYDEGEYDATGACTGGYLGCQCGNVGASFKTPSKSWAAFLTYENPDQGIYDYEWYWVITNYLAPVVSGCTTGPCQGSPYYTENDGTWIDENAGYDVEEVDCDI